MATIELAHQLRNPIRSRRNKYRVVRTPGNRLVRQKLPRPAIRHICPISGKKLNGLPHCSANGLSRVGKYARRVSRPYGGCLAHSVVRDKILKAFFRVEKECVQAVMFEKAKAAKAEAKKSGKK